jgi:lysosomal alpha-mannosidase
VKRTRTAEPHECFKTKSNISANYYPIKNKIFIRDESKGMQMTVLTDRSQGGSSLTDGQLELMIQRRLTHALYIGLNETGSDKKGIVITGKHYLFFKPINESAKLFRDLSQRLFMQPLITFSPLTQSETDYRNKFQTSYSALNKELPQNIHLLSLEQWKKNQILVRLEHFYESVDNNDLSKPIEVDLQNLLKPFKILNLTEMTLTANQILSETHRMKWKSNKYFSESESIPNRIVRDINFKIQLSPQQIRTFIITTEDNKEVKGIH